MKSFLKTIWHPMTWKVVIDIHQFNCHYVFMLHLCPVCIGNCWLLRTKCNNQDEHMNTIPVILCLCVGVVSGSEVILKEPLLGALKRSITIGWSLHVTCHDSLVYWTKQRRCSNSGWRKRALKEAWQIRVHTNILNLSVCFPPFSCPD